MPVVRKGMHSSTQFAYKRLRVGKGSDPERGPPDVGDRQRSSRPLLLQQTHQRAFAGGDGFAKQRHVMTLVKRGAQPSRLLQLMPLWLARASSEKVRCAAWRVDKARSSHMAAPARAFCGWAGRSVARRYAGSRTARLRCLQVVHGRILKERRRGSGKPPGRMKRRVCRG